MQIPSPSLDEGESTVIEGEASPIWGDMACLLLLPVVNGL